MKRMLVVGIVLVTTFVTSTIASAQPGGRRFGGFGGFGGGPTGPLVEPEDIAVNDGVSRLESREEYERLSYQGPDVMIDVHLANLEYVKFILLDATSDDPRMYFMNTEAYRAHMMFARIAGIPFNPMSADGSAMFGVLTYRPELRAPNGQLGLYSFEFEPNNVFDFEVIQAAYDRLIEHAPILAGRLAFHPLPAAVGRFQQQSADYEAANLPVLLDDELYAGVSFLPLNPAEGYGLLRVMELDDRPGERDVVLYRSLPNELPRVAGIITAVPQTPLSHVNLRAVQDRVPNAYIKGAASDDEIAGLVGRYVYYRVEPSGYELREATAVEVETHFETLRPAEAQVPFRDLSVTAIRALDEIGFGDSVSVGVKAANVATLRRIGLPEAVVPDGFAIPFYFYDEFMKLNGLYGRAAAMRAVAGFSSDADVREEMLAEFRQSVMNAEMPAWMLAALTELQERFPPGTSIRLRSSTNNEDLPGFSGAGLYDSFTHREGEGHLRSPSSRFTQACGTSALMRNVNSIESIISWPQWAYWSIRIFRTKSQTASRSVTISSTRTHRQGRLWRTTSIRKWAKILLPTQTSFRFPKRFCSTQPVPAATGSLRLRIGPMAS